MRGYPQRLATGCRVTGSQPPRRRGTLSRQPESPLELPNLTLKPAHTLVQGGGLVGHASAATR